MKLNHDAPTFTVKPWGQTQWRFFCPYCGIFHYHGRDEGNFGEHRYRVAHCYKANSPLRKTGYYLQTTEERESQESSA